MKTHTLIQGSPEWHAHRADSDNASDAPAMMGASPYMTRSQLLEQRHTGEVRAVDAATQRIFDDGHRFEALARPLAEEIIGESLYPVVGSEGRLSASFDGITMAEDLCFEHKTLNKDLRAAMLEGCTGANLPAVYRIQMEQQLMISGAERCLFMATKWEGEIGSERLVESRHCWYMPDLELRAQIIAGWEQFEKDLQTYERKVVQDKPIANAIQALPALAIQIRGEVIASNLPRFKQEAESFIERINTDLKTDTDFANAEATVKFCEKAEKSLAAAKEAIIGQTGSIDEILKTVQYIQDQLCAKRLMLDKLVTKKKDELKGNILSKARNAYVDHLIELELEIVPVELGNLPMPDFAGAMKNKRTLSTMQDAVDTMMANAKIEADGVAKKVRANLAWLKDNNPGYQIPDIKQIALKPYDDFVLLLQARFTEITRAAAEADAKQRTKADQIVIPVVAPTAPTDGAPAVVSRQTLAPTISVGNVTPMRPALRPAAPSTPPSLKLGQIADRLGFALTAEFLSELGFTATQDRNAKLYHESDFPRICSALVNHINHVGELQAA